MNDRTLLNSVVGHDDGVWIADTNMKKKRKRERERREKCRYYCLSFGSKMSENDGNGVPVYGPHRNEDIMCWPTSIWK